MIGAAPPTVTMAPLNSTPVAIVAPPALVVSVVVWVALAAAGVPLLGAVAPVAAAGLLVAALLWLRAPRVALRALQARPLMRGAHPRLENLVQGLCTTHGFSRPAVHVVETDAVNAAAAGLRRPPAHLIVTRGALSGLDRLELEAVVTRQLCEIRRGVWTVTVLASAARVPVTGRLAARQAARARGFDRVMDVDLESVRLTGFPPALASALKKAVEGPGTDSSAAAAHLWLVAPSPTGSAVRREPSAIQRIDVLEEI